MCKLVTTLLCGDHVLVFLTHIHFTSSVVKFLVKCDLVGHVACV